MTIWPFVHFFVLCVYATLAVVVLAGNVRSRSNQVLAIFLAAMSIWSFAAIFVHSPYTTFQEVAFYDNIAAIGWISFAGIFFIWVNVFVDNKAFFRRRLHYLVVFVIAVLFFQQLNGNILASHTRQPYGWSNVWSPSIWRYIFMLYYIAVTAAAIVILARHMRKANPLQRKQTQVLVVAVIAPFILGSSSDILLPTLGIFYIPDLASVFSLILPALVIYAMARYKFLIITPALAADNIISTMTDFLILFNPHGLAVTANKAFLDISDCSPEELHSKSIDDFFPAPEGSKLLSQEMRQKGIIRNYECFLSTKNRGAIPVSVSLSELRDAHGVAAGFVCIARDISEFIITRDFLRQAKESLESEVANRTLELQHTNEQLNRSYETTKDILQKAPFGIQLVNAEGQVEYINEAMLAISGMANNYPAETNIFEIAAHREIGLDIKIQTLLSRGESFFIKAAKISSYYAKKPAIVNFIGIPIEEESVRKALIFIEDITDKTHMEEEMLKVHKLESVGLLAGGIAHDFNNILSVVLGNTSFARGSVPAGSTADEALAETEKAVKRACELTQQLLVFARGGAPIKKTMTISRLLKDTVRFALRGSRSQALYIIPSDLWPTEIDIGQINQVIQNLTINADQSMPEGGTVTVSAANILTTTASNLPLPPGKYVRFSIKDTGVGIPAENLRTIFDPYFSTKQKGHGLGLAVCYSVVKKHNGYIKVDSIPGKGTTFTVYLPASENIPEQTAEPDEKIITGEGHILIMDDEHLIRNALVRMLTDLGYTVENASRGEEAVELYTKAKNENRKFDLVILDLTVAGGMGGLQALQKMKEIDPRIKAIVSSGYSNNPIMAEYEKHGFIGVIPKPYNIKSISKTVCWAIKEAVPPTA